MIGCVGCVEESSPELNVTSDEIYAEFMDILYSYKPRVEGDKLYFDSVESSTIKNHFYDIGSKYKLKLELDSNKPMIAGKINDGYCNSNSSYYFKDGCIMQYTEYTCTGGNIATLCKICTSGHICASMFY